MDTFSYSKTTTTSKYPTLIQTKHESNNSDETFGKINKKKQSNI